MPNRFNFTKKKIEELSSLSKRMEFYDEQVRCLCIRNSLGGQLSFYIKKTVSNRTLRLFIGRYPEVSIEQARKKANDILYNIANEHLILPFERKLLKLPTPQRLLMRPKHQPSTNYLISTSTTMLPFTVLGTKRCAKTLRDTSGTGGTDLTHQFPNWMFFHASI